SQVRILPGVPFPFSINDLTLPKSLRRDLTVASVQQCITPVKMRATIIFDPLDLPRVFRSATNTGSLRNIRNPEYSVPRCDLLQAEAGEFALACSEICKMRKIGRDRLKPAVFREDLAHPRIVELLHVKSKH